MKNGRKIAWASALSFALACIPAGTALSDENGYGENIRGTVFGAAGHHSNGRNGRYWIPQSTGESIGILKVYRTQAVINIEGDVYWTDDVKWDPVDNTYDRVCVVWPDPVPSSGGCWRVRKNDNPDLQFTANSRLP
jgi:hypothetical protein